MQQAILRSLEQRDRHLEALVNPNIQQAWGHYLAARMTMVHPLFWDELEDETYGVVMRFVHRSEAQYRQEREQREQAQRASAVPNAAVPNAAIPNTTVPNTTGTAPNVDIRRDDPAPGTSSEVPLQEISLEHLTEWARTLTSETPAQRPSSRQGQRISLSRRGSPRGPGGFIAGYVGDTLALERALDLNTSPSPWRQPVYHIPSPAPQDAADVPDVPDVPGTRQTGEDDGKGSGGGGPPEI